MTNRYSIRAIYHGPAYWLRGKRRLIDDTGLFVMHEGDRRYLKVFR